MKIDTLIRQAKDSAFFRKHDMGNFRHDGDTAEGVCKKCGRAAIVHAHPPINGIEIHGEAVAFHCDGGTA